MGFSFLKQIKVLVALITIVFFFTGACSKHSSPSRSSLDTVHIPVTSAKDQYGVGFCWAYTAAGLMEALLLRNGTTVDLSEEYLGFYHIIDQLQQALKLPEPVAGLKNVSEGYRVLEALKLAEVVGMVPEEVFSFKFDETGDLQARINGYFARTFQDPSKVDAYRNNKNLLIEEAAQIFGKRPPAPTDSFTYQGRKYTAVSFMKDFIGIHASDFQKFDYTPDNIDILNHYLKRALIDKYPVPFSTMTLFGLGGDNPVWDAENCKDTGCLPDGGHAMLAVDFVTENGRGGDMPLSEVKKVFHNPFDSVIVKNSWGLVGNDQDGNPTSNESKTGFFTIKRNFIETAITRGGVEIVVPKSILAEDHLFFESKLQVAVDSSDIKKGFVKVGASSVFKAMVLGVTNKQDFANISFAWTIKNRSTNEAATTLKGKTANFTPRTPGVYEVAVKATVGREEHTATRLVWAADRISDNIFSLNAAFATNNMAEIVGEGAQSHLVVDTTKELFATDLVSSIVQLPDMKFTDEGKMKVTLHVSELNSLSRKLQVSLDGKSYEDMWCDINTDNIGDTPVRELKEADEECIYPIYGGFSGAGNVKVRMIFYQMPQEEQKWKGVLTINPVSLDLANISIQQAQETIYAPAKYPRDSIYKNAVSLGSGRSFEGLFGSDIDEVNVYVDDSRVQTINHANFASADQGFLKASYNYQPNRVGINTITLVGVKNGVETSFVNYELMTAKAAAVNSRSPWQLSKSTIDANEWINTAYGLSATLITENAGKPDPKPLKDNNYTSVLFAFDLSASRGTVLGAAAIYMLEDNFDFFHIKVSGDGGKTFTTLSKETGDGSKGKNITLDLSKYDGVKDVLVRFDAITDAGGLSRLILVKDMIIKSN